MPKIKKYPGVFQDNKGQWYYQIMLGSDTTTRKPITKKGRKDQAGRKFSSAKEASDEVMRLKVAWNEAHGYGNYQLTFDQFLNDYFIAYYETKVQAQTFVSKASAFKKLSV